MSDASVTDAPPGIRWRPAGIILLVGGALMLTAWYALGLDRTYQVFSLWALVPATALALLTWWLFASRVPWPTRVLGVVVSVGVIGCLRVDGYEGDMYPLVLFRWQATKAERAQEYFDGAGRTPPQASVAAETLVPGPGDWPGYRGRGRSGVVDVELARDWSARPPRLAWRHPIGLGWSSFAVVDGRVFTQEQRGELEVVSCWNLADGSPLWVHSDATRFAESMGGVGPRATPTFDSSRIYALGANGLLNCLDAGSGRTLWSKDVLRDTAASNLEWAMAGSPLVVDGKVVVNTGGARGAVVAYDAETGQRAWAAGNRAASYAAPRLASINGESVILVFGGDGLSAHAIADGKELWHFPWSNGPKVNAALPIPVSPNRVLISSGYGRGTVLLSVDPNVATPGIAWQSRRMKCKFNDPVVHDGFVYGLDEGILVCLDLHTGSRRWKRGRYGYGQMLLVGDLLLVLAENGSVVLVEANPDKFRELGRFDAISGKTWNQPVLVGKRLLVRNAGEVACFDLP